VLTDLLWAVDDMYQERKQSTEDRSKDQVRYRATIGRKKFRDQIGNGEHANREHRQRHRFAPTSYEPPADEGNNRHLSQQGASEANESKHCDRYSYRRRNS